MIKQVFIINGSGGVGKDTFVEIAMCSDKCIIRNYSSVSKVKEIARLIGWDGSKSEKDRKFLSDLKLLTTEYNDMPLNDLKKYVNGFMKKSIDPILNKVVKCKKPKIVFLHIREPEEIARAVVEFEEYNVKTILVKRDSVEHIISNMADENVYNYNYDIVINNDSDIKELRDKATNFISDFLEDNLKNEY